MILGNTDDNIKNAAKMLQQDQLVVFPTETVYGLGANALSDQAVQKIYEFKGRPAHNPLIIHVASIEQAQEFVEWPDIANILAHQFWPGPITFVLPQKNPCMISKIATAGLSTLAVRLPNHPIAQKVLQRVGRPIAAPSANPSGKLSTTTPMDVEAAFKNQKIPILAGGAAEIGLESTVLDLSSDQPNILRHGSIHADQIEGLLGSKLDIIFKNNDETPQAPGMLTKHYAPNTPLRLNAVDVEEGEALLAFGSIQFMGLKGGGFAKDLPKNRILNLSEAGNLEEAAHNLFTKLRQLDRSDVKKIAIMSIPKTGIGWAINDRLRRAAC